MTSLTALNILLVFVVNGCSAVRHSAVTDPVRFNRAATSTTSGVRPLPPQSGAGLGPIVYRINEDCEPGTIVGDIRRDGDLDQRIPGANRAIIDQLKFVLLAREDGITAGGSADRPQTIEDDGNPSRHFSLDLISGLIRAATALDRDRICPEAETCILEINVAVQPPKYFRIIRVIQSIGKTR